MLVNISKNRTLIESKQDIKGPNRSFKNTLLAIFGNNFMFWFSPKYTNNDLQIYEKVYQENINCYKRVPNFIANKNK